MTSRQRVSCPDIGKQVFHCLLLPAFLPHVLFIDTLTPHWLLLSDSPVMNTIEGIRYSVRCTLRHAHALDTNYIHSSELVIVRYVPWRTDLAFHSLMEVKINILQLTKDAVFVLFWHSNSWDVYSNTIRYSFPSGDLHWTASANTRPCTLGYLNMVCHGLWYRLLSAK